MTDTERQEVENLKRLAVGIVRSCERMLDANRSKVTVEVVCANVDAVAFMTRDSSGNIIAATVAAAR